MATTVLTSEGTRSRVSSEKAFLDWLVSPHANDTVAIDTETDGLAWMDRVRLVQFGDTDTGFAIVVTDLAGRDLVSRAIRMYHGVVAFHNAPFDIHALSKIGVSPDYLWPRAVDTYVMAHVQDPRASHGLDDLTKAWLNVDDKEWKSEFRRFLKGQEYVYDAKKDKTTLKRIHRVWDYSTVPFLRLAPYGIADAVNTARLYGELMKALSPVEHEVVLKEMEVETAVYEVMGHGLRLDREYALSLQDSWVKWLADEREWFFQEYGVKNPNSNPQVIDALVKHGWVPQTYTEGGQAVLDKEVLKELVTLDQPYHIQVIAGHLKEFKRITKWLASYVDTSLEEADPWGFVHARYNSMGAKTGRMSCSQPPLQQLPKGGGGEVRRLFIASEGNVICSVDYDNIEFRLGGAIADEPRIIEAYLKGSDIYTDYAAAVGITRPQAKIVVLATMYGWAGGSDKAGIGFSVGKMKQLVSSFWDTYPRLNQWNLSMTHKARYGAVTSRWGRTLGPKSPYAAGNSVIQGTAAEILKEGLLRLAERGLLKYVAAIVHDEVVLDVPVALAESVTAQVVEALEDHSYVVPLTASGEVYGPSWGDGYTA